MQGMRRAFGCTQQTHLRVLAVLCGRPGFSARCASAAKLPSRALLAGAVRMRRAGPSD
jgi:hypothetical protein